MISHLIKTCELHNTWPVQIVWLVDHFLFAWHPSIHPSCCDCDEGFACVLVLLTAWGAAERTLCTAEWCIHMYRTLPQQPDGTSVGATAAAGSCLAISQYRWNEVMSFVGLAPQVFGRHLKGFELITHFIIISETKLIYFL